MDSRDKKSISDQSWGSLVVVVILYILLLLGALVAGSVAGLVTDLLSICCQFVVDLLSVSCWSSSRNSSSDS